MNFSEEFSKSYGTQISALSYSYSQQAMLLQRLLEDLDSLTKAREESERKNKSNKIEVLDSSVKDGVYSTTVSSDFHYANTGFVKILYKSSILTVASNVEMLVNYFSELVSKLNDEISLESVLNNKDLLILREKKIDDKNNEVHQNYTLKERIKHVPKCLGKLKGEDVVLDTKSDHWDYFKIFKNLRDSFTHPKASMPDFSFHDLLDSVKFLYWLNGEYFSLLKEVIKSENYWPWLCMTQGLYKSLHISNLILNKSKEEIIEQSKYLEELQSKYKESKIQ